MENLIRKFIPSFLINWYHLGLAFLGAVLYCFPSRKLVVIGVTGTKGKSTVVDFCHRIFQEAGFQVASLSSIRFKIGEKEQPNLLKMTMPGRFKIQKFLRQAKNSGCKYVILEVTSEGILQHRHQFINFNTAVFTNLAPEHIERHGSFENYRAAKGKLFEATKSIHIINLDDENAKYFLQFPANKKYTYGLNKGDINAKDIQLKLQLMADFNIYNALTAICVGLSQGISSETSVRVLEKIKGLPGRMEVVIREPFKVIVDYAHTPDALQKVYETLSAKSKIKNQKSKMICVLGSAGGGRDKWKRPKMGEIAAKHCDQIILTNEDPYDENPEQIIKEIKVGIQNTKYPDFIEDSSDKVESSRPSRDRQSRNKIQNTRIILDRKEAIREAIKTAKAGDIVIITGKGCEPWMCAAKGKKIPWDDREIVREQFRGLKIQD